MGEHPHVATIDRMTQAIFERDRATLDDVFTSDLVFHMRGCLPRPGDHAGVDGPLDALGAIFVHRRERDNRATELPGRGRVGHRVGARAAAARGSEVGDEELVRLPVPRRPDRRDGMINAELPGKESFWD
jgi:hypothetical protein